MSPSLSIRRNRSAPRQHGCIWKIKMRKEKWKVAKWQSTHANWPLWARNLFQRSRRPRSKWIPIALADGEEEKLACVGEYVQSECSDFRRKGINQCSEHCYYLSSMTCVKWKIFENVCEEDGIDHITVFCTCQHTHTHIHTHILEDVYCPQIGHLRNPRRLAYAHNVRLCHIRYILFTS